MPSPAPRQRSLLPLVLACMLLMSIIPMLVSSPVGAAGSVLTAPPVGQIVSSIDGIEVKSNGGKLLSDTEGQYGWQYQCVELIQRYYASKWGYTPRWGGNAKDLMTTAPSGIQRIYNSGNPSPPRRYDALVLSGGQHGHVALVTDVYNGRVYFVEQNWGPTELTTGQDSFPISATNIVSSTRSGYSVLGWLRPQQPSTAPTSATYLKVEFKLPGIGIKVGDVPPRNLTRASTLEIYNLSNQLVATRTATANYARESGTFKASFLLGSTFNSGQYRVKFRITGSLKKALPEVDRAVTISRGVTSHLTITHLAKPDDRLAMGDANGDNRVSLHDYNSLVSCWGGTCANADFNDNGRVDVVDYNILVTNFGKQGE